MPCFQARVDRLFTLDRQLTQQAADIQRLRADKVGGSSEREGGSSAPLTELGGRLAYLLTAGRALSGPLIADR